MNDEIKARIEKLGHWPEWPKFKTYRLENGILLNESAYKFYRNSGWILKEIEPMIVDPTQVREFLPGLYDVKKSSEVHDE